MTTAEKVYLDAQAACGLKPGDWVKVTRIAESNEAGWDNVWGPSMNEAIGHVGQITKINAVGVSIVFGGPVNNWWYFPYFVLEKVEKPDYQFKPFDRVLVRDRATQPWSCSFFSHKDGGKFFSVNYVIWNECIPYEGNEHLVGTTGKPECL